MPQYISQEITAQAPKQAVVAFFSDAFALAGASGHFAILQVWDESSGRWVSPSAVKGVARKFRASFVAQLPKGDEVKGILGTFEGPVVTPSASGVKISYSGITDDGTITMSFDATVRSDRPGQTKVQMSMAFEVKQSFFSSLFKRSDFDMAKHIVDDHLVPYLLYYFNPVNRSPTPTEGVKVEPTEVFKEEGPLMIVLPKALKAVSQMSYGVISVRGDKAVGKIYIVNGKPVEFDVKMGNKELEEASALAELLTSDELGEVAAYAIDIEQVAFQVLRSIPIKKVA